jgi:hypothetical protein
LYTGGSNQYEGNEEAGHIWQYAAMMVKDHLTGLVYLCALPRKKAQFVAAELEKYFGLIGYPEIFHTGVYTFTCFMLSQ